MSDAVERWKSVSAAIAGAESQVGREPGTSQLVAVSKTYDGDAIWPVIEAGQRVFGENRVQEAMEKWPVLRERCADPLELHLIGPLQSNKAKEAVATFDVIQTVDREKIASALSKEMKRQGRHLPCYVQVNTGKEPQKAGLPPEHAHIFVKNCRDIHTLNVVGLMCIPPIGDDPAPHFEMLAKLAKRAGVANCSMGMSGDFDTAIRLGATQVRIGSAIFGART